MAASEKPEKTAYVYMVRCAGGQLYTGWTNDPEARLKVKFLRLQQSKRFALTGGLPHGKALTAQKRRQRLIDRAVILHQQDPFHIRASHPVILPLIIPQRHKICKTSQPFDIIRFLSGSFIFRSICAQKID